MSLSRPLIATALAGIACSILACGGPLVMLPGGALSGTPTPAPSDWDFTHDVDTIQLETRPADPYSVNVWGVGIGDRLYVACGKRENRWGQYMLEDPDVRVRVGSAIYELRATPVEDEAQREVFLAAMAEKYEFEPSPEEQAEAQLFALSARQ